MTLLYFIMEDNMGLLKKLGDWGRRQNDKWEAESRSYEEIRYNLEKREENYKNSLECCENCGYFCHSSAVQTSRGMVFYPCCLKHNFHFEHDFAHSGKSYTKTCNDFIRK